MKEYIATIKLTEGELKDVIAGYFGVDKSEVYLNVIKDGAWEEDFIVTCEIKKKINVLACDDPLPHRPPGVREAKTKLIEETAYEHYCPNNL